MVNKINWMVLLSMSSSVEGIQTFHRFATFGLSKKQEILVIV